MAFDNHVNLLTGTVQVAPSPSTSGSSLTLMPGDATRFQPNMPVTLTPPNSQPNHDNAEIAYVTAVTGSVLTLTRAQEGTTAMQVQVGWQVIGSITAKTITDVEGALASKVDKIGGKDLSSNDYTTTDKSKLAGIASGATANDTDANLKNRANHTGTQAESTVLNLVTDLAAKVAKGSIVYNVKDYGATGNGSTDDTAAIQSTIDAANTAGGGTVFLPIGTYIYSAAINLKSNINFVGASKSAILKGKNATSTIGLSLVSLTNVTIQNLTINGNRSNNTDDGIEVTQDSIFVDQSSGCTIQNCTIINSAKTAIFFSTSSTQNKIIDNTITNASRNGIYLSFNANNNNVISNNTINGTNSYHGINISNSSYNAITGNTITGAAQNGIDLDGGSTGNTITGNTCQGNLWTGITLRGESGTPLYNVVTGNTVVLNYREGIRLEGAQQTVVSSNTVYNNSQEANGYYNGIRLDTAGSFSNPTNNMVIGNRVSTNHSYGVDIESVGSNNYVGLNYLEGGTATTNDLGTGNKFVNNYYTNGGVLTTIREAKVINAPSGKDPLVIKINDVTKYTFNQYGEFVSAVGYGIFYDSNISTTAFSSPADMWLTAGASGSTNSSVNIKASGTTGKINLLSPVASPTLTTPVISGTPTGSGVDTAATPNTLALRDTNGNVLASSLVPGFTTTVTASGTTTLTAASNEEQFFTGSQNQTLVLPTTGIPAGQRIFLHNFSSGVIAVQSSNLTGMFNLTTSGTTTLTAAVASPTLSTDWNISHTTNLVFRTQPTTSTNVQRDTNANVLANNFWPTATTTATAGGNTVLTNSSSQVQIFTGSSTQNILLPTTSVIAGTAYRIINISSANLIIQTAAAVNIITARAGTETVLRANVATPTNFADWTFEAWPATTAPSTSTAAVRDGNGNLAAAGFIPSVASTTSAAGTTVLTVNSAQMQRVTGSVTQVIQLPTTGIVDGTSFIIDNKSTVSITVTSSTGAGVATVQTNTTLVVRANTATPTLASHWNLEVIPYNTGNAGSTLVQRNSSGQVTSQGFIPVTTSIATAGGTTAFGNNSAQIVIFTGTSAQIATLPSVTVVAGQYFTIINQSTGLITVNAYAGALVGYVPSNTSASFQAIIAAPTLPTDWSITSYAAVAGVVNSTVPLRDAGGNLYSRNFVTSVTTTATAGGTTALSASTSSGVQVFTGTTTQTITLPSVGNPGWPFTIVNQSTGTLTVNANGGGLVATVPAGGNLTVQSNVINPTTAAGWTILNQTIPPKVTEYSNSSTSAAVNATNVAVPSGAVGVRVKIIAGGAGGGSGRRGAAASIRGGGGAGSNQSLVMDYYLPITQATYNYYLGKVGSGGAAVTVDSTDGNAGTAMDPCYFQHGSAQVGTSSTTLTAGFGGTSTVGGIAGNSVLRDVNSQAVGQFLSGGAGGASANAGLGNDGMDSWAPLFPSGGGGGGGITAGDVVGAGGNGGRQRQYASPALTPGGIVDTTPPAVPANANASGLPGQGGGGGAASKTTAAQAGADGVGYGAPGGGGGASLNGFNSGRGGNGGPSYMRLEWVYA